MTRKQYYINVICACLFCFGIAAMMTGTQKATGVFGMGWVFASIITAIFNNIKIKE